MGDVFGWLGNLMETLGSLLPTWHHLECTDVGATVTRGKRVHARRPGIIWYWPFWTTLYYRAANIQTVNLPTQTLMSSDGKRIAVGGMVRFRIDDAVKSLVETNDVGEAIIDESLAVICELITCKPAEVIFHTTRAKINSALTKRARAQMSMYGVVVERVQLTDCSTCITLNHVGVADMRQIAEE